MTLRTFAQLDDLRAEVIKLTGQHRLAICLIIDHQLGYFLIDYSSIWGFTSVTYERVSLGWKDEFYRLQQLDPAEGDVYLSLILELGGVQIGSQRVTLDDLTQYLVGLLKTSNLPAASCDYLVGTLIEIGGTQASIESSEAIFQQVLGKAALLGVLTAHPEKHDLESWNQGWEAKLPYQLTLTIAVYQADQLQLGELTLLDEQSRVVVLKNQQPALPHFIGVTQSLYLWEGEKTSWIVVRRKLGTQVEVVKCWTAEIDQQPFAVECSLRFGETEPAIVVQRAERQVELGSTVQLPRLPVVKRIIEPVEIGLLIDGSLADYDALRNFARHLLRLLTQQNVTVQVGYAVYGDYVTAGRSAANIVSFDIAFEGLNAVQQIDDFADHLPNLDNFQRVRYALALEKGLRVMVRNFVWRSSVRHLILVGSSPPHPTADEHRRFRLGETTTDFFEDIDWKAEIDQLRQHAAKAKAHLTTHAVWVPPRMSLLPAQREYANHVWRTFAQHGDPYVELTLENATLISEKIAQPELRSAKYVAEAAVNYPLTRLP